MEGRESIQELSSLLTVASSSSQLSPRVKKRQQAQIRNKLTSARCCQCSASVTNSIPKWGVQLLKILFWHGHWDNNNTAHVALYLFVGAAGRETAGVWRSMAKKKLGKCVFVCVCVSEERAKGSIVFYSREEREKESCVSVCVFPSFPSLLMLRDPAQRATHTLAVLVLNVNNSPYNWIKPILLYYKCKVS